MPPRLVITGGTVSESTDCKDKDDVPQEPTADSTSLDSLLAALASYDGIARQRARRDLVVIGRPAVAPLIKALTDPNDDVRWEAAKALGQISDPAAAPALVNALEDEVSAVRWLGAEGLIALGRGGLVPLLQALEQRSDSVWLREGAHHVLHDLARGDLEDVLSPVLAALEDIEPAIEVPWAARAALVALEKATRRL
jgi:HEAT repeat protein